MKMGLIKNEKRLLLIAFLTMLLILGIVVFENITFEISANSDDSGMQATEGIFLIKPYGIAALVLVFISVIFMIKFFKKLK